jgi:hypothetical protein
MKKAALILTTVAALGATAVTAPAEARRGWGPGAAIGFGLAAGALAAGAYGAYGPYYGYGYGPGYGYYRPRYYRPAYYGYGPGPYAYYGGPRYYRPYRHYGYW